MLWILYHDDVDGHVCVVFTVSTADTLWSKNVAYILSWLYLYTTNSQQNTFKCRSRLCFPEEQIKKVQYAL